MERVYMIPGLGAQSSIFEKLNFQNLQMVHVKWIKPYQYESLSSYAKRLLEQIPQDAYNIVGLSFGGMLASEMALMRPNAKVIIVSSCSHAHQLPAWYRIGKWLPLHLVQSNRLEQTRLNIMQRILGIRSTDEKAFFQNMWNATNHTWANEFVQMILKWALQEKPRNVFHIHGTKDRLLPHPTSKVDHSLTNGTHWMIREEAHLLSSIIEHEVMTSKKHLS